MLGVRTATPRGRIGDRGAIPSLGVGQVAVLRLHAGLSPRDATIILPQRGLRTPWGTPLPVLAIRVDPGGPPMTTRVARRPIYSNV